jgi:predicted transcriptional regulator
MKEGYLQTKIREIDYKLRQQMALAEQLEQQLQRIIISKKEHKALLNKLKDLDKFKDRILKELAEENKAQVQSIKDELHEIVDKHIIEVVEKKISGLEKYIDKAVEGVSVRDLIWRNSRSIAFNEQLCLLLMEELINERVLSKERVDIISKRASMRAKKVSPGVE